MSIAALPLPRWRQRQFIFHYRHGAARQQFFIFRRGAAAADVQPRWTPLSYNFVKR
jgi:hypothetical protein